MRTILTSLLLASSVVLATARAAPLDGEAVAQFIDEMVREHAFERAALEATLARAERSDRIISLMSRPAEKVKPWFEYRPLFISKKRIRDGVAFWNDHAEILAKAHDHYGVAPEVIVAILGVETAYGRISGGHRVLDALATLAFHYPGDRPARAAYFRTQLEQFLLMAREYELDPQTLEGSYAGAMGMPQFMPENYRKLAVDFDGDGRRDIWSNPSDAVGSIANYLAHHGWQPGGPVMSPAQVSDAPDAFLTTSIAPEFTLGDLRAAGIVPSRTGVSANAAAALFELEGRDAPEYWIGYKNFYVISRYNPRVKYTMAVAQLAEAIVEARAAAER